MSFGASLPQFSFIDRQKTTIRLPSAIHIRCKQGAHKHEHREKTAREHHAVAILEIEADALRLGSTGPRANSGYAVHVCAAARPRASCPCRWECRLLGTSSRQIFAEAAKFAKTQTADAAAGNPNGNGNSGKAAKGRWRCVWRPSVASLPSDSTARPLELAEGESKQASRSRCRARSCKLALPGTSTGTDTCFAASA